MAVKGPDAGSTVARGAALACKTVAARIALTRKRVRTEFGMRGILVAEDYRRTTRGPVDLFEFVVPRAKAYVKRARTTCSRHSIYSPEAMMIAAPISVSASGFSPKTASPMISAKTMRE